jgi:ParB-like chromosome segregation protein Spo0J
MAHFPKETPIANALEGSMEVALRPIQEIIPYARNARRIPPAAIDKVAASIREFGWRQPIVIDGESVVIAGHTRLLAAQKLGLNAVPVHVAIGLTDAQVKAYRLMDNRSHQDATWDDGLLAIELTELKDMAMDLSLTGFEVVEIDVGAETERPHRPSWFARVIGVSGKGSPLRD